MMTASAPQLGPLFQNAVPGGRYEEAPDHRRYRGGSFAAGDDRFAVFDQREPVQADAGDGYFRRAGTQTGNREHRSGDVFRRGFRSERFHRGRSRIQQIAVSDGEGADRRREPDTSDILEET